MAQRKPAQIEVYRATRTRASLPPAYQAVQKEGDAVIAKANVAGEGQAAFAVEDRWKVSGAVLSLSRKVSVTGAETNAGFFSAIRLLTATRSNGRMRTTGPGPALRRSVVRRRTFARRHLELPRQALCHPRGHISAPLFALSFRDGRWAAVMDLAPRGDTTLAETTASAATPVIDERIQFGALGAREVAMAGSSSGSGCRAPPPSSGAVPRRRPPPTVRRRYHPVKAGFSQSYQVGFRFGQGASFRDMERDAWRWAWETLKPKTTPVDIEVVRRTLLDHLEAHVVTVEGRTGVPFFYDAVTGQPGSYRGVDARRRCAPAGTRRAGVARRSVRPGGPGRQGAAAAPIAQERALA